jgi:hypothetical protein
MNFAELAETHNAYKCRAGITFAAAKKAVDGLTGKGFKRKAGPLEQAAEFRKLRETLNAKGNGQ